MSTEQNTTKNDNPKSVRQILAHGNRLIEEKKYSEALLLFEQNLEKPEIPQDLMLSQIGIVLFSQGKVEDAETFFLKALQQDSSLIEANFNLGVLYQHAGSFEKALPYFKQAIIEGGNDAEIFERMADCCYALQNKTDAESFYDAALKMRPNSVNAAVKLAEIYLEKKQIEKALSVLQIGIVSHPDVPEFYVAVGNIYKQMGELERALAHFRKVVLLDETSFEGFYQLGEICRELGMLKQAFPFYAKAYKLYPLPCLLHQMGKIYEKQNNRLAASQMYDKWIENEKENINSKDEQDKQEYERVINWLAKYYSSSGDLLSGIKMKTYLNILKKSQENSIDLKKRELTSLQLD